MLIPTFFVRDLEEAISFYTKVLDFQLAADWPDAAPFYAVLARETNELHLSVASGERPRVGCTAIVVCDGIDALFTQFIVRGLLPSTRTDSPVHEGPVDQTWGTREVYIDDPSGNTLCFQQRSPRAGRQCSPR